MAVDINLVKQLRDSTQAPLKDCKEALDATNWDLAKAMEYLKEKGLSKAAKKADRETNEWVVKVRKSGDLVVWIKLWCETDFVAKNENFIALTDILLSILEKSWKEISSLSELDSAFVDSEISPVINENIARIWENIRLLDAFVKKWNAFVYSHPWDKIATVIFYNSSSDYSELAKELALQITAMNPTYKSIEDVPSDMKDTMKADAFKEMEWSNKPADVLEKIVEGKLSKRFEEFVFMEQVYIRDESKKIKHIIPADFELVNYIRFSILN